MQLNHRLVAYLDRGIGALARLRMRVLHAGSSASRRATVSPCSRAAQMVLGITTLVLVVPLWAGLGHQILAMMLLAMTVVHVRLS